MRLGEDDSLLYQPTQHELNAAVTPRTGQPMDLAPGRENCVHTRKLRDLTSDAWRIGCGSW